MPCSRPLLVPCSALAVPPRGGPPPTFIFRARWGTRAAHEVLGMGRGAEVLGMGRGAEVLGLGRGAEVLGLGHGAVVLGLPMY